MISFEWNEIFACPAVAGAVVGLMLRARKPQRLPKIDSHRAVYSTSEISDICYRNFKLPAEYFFIGGGIFHKTLIISTIFGFEILPN